MTRPAPAARFLDVWLDAHDVAAVARFWAGALGMDMHPEADGSVQLRGERAWHSLWVRPSSHACGHCAIHVDVTTEHITRFLELGARVVDASSYPWVVLSGPEGCEICAFPPDRAAAATGAGASGGSGRPSGADPHRQLLDLLVDTADPVAAAAWWAELLDTTYHAAADDDYAWVEPVPGAPFESIVYARQDPGSPTAGCRIRPRVTTHDLGALFARGATHAADGRPGETMLRDPVGNEFFVTVSDLVVRPDDE